jgi:hypothetical protein
MGGLAEGQPNLEAACKVASIPASQHFSTSACKLLVLADWLKARFAEGQYLCKSR